MDVCEESLEKLLRPFTDCSQSGFLLLWRGNQSNRLCHCKITIWICAYMSMQIHHIWETDKAWSFWVRSGYHLYDVFVGKVNSQDKHWWTRGMLLLTLFELWSLTLTIHKHKECMNIKRKQHRNGLILWTICTTDITRGKLVVRITEFVRTLREIDILRNK